MTNSTSKSTLVDRLKILISPTAIGIYLSLLFAVVAKKYYNVRDLPEGRQGPFKFIYDFDQKTIDYRLNFRGQRAVHQDVAVLAVDDRSINLIGRWPWPRQIVAKALEAAYSHGAKVIAADVVWSEPTDRPEVRLLSQLSQEGAISPSATPKINELLNQNDDDRILAEFIDRHKQRFVLGNFFEEVIVKGASTGITASCLNLAYANSALAKIQDSQERPPIINELAFEIPSKISDLYLHENGPFKTIELNTLEKLPPAQTVGEFSQYARIVQEAQNHFCFTSFFNPERDDVAAAIKENWEQVAPEFFDGQIPAPSFEEWVQSLSQFDIPTVIPEVLDWTLNIPKIYNNGINHGYFNTTLDGDGVIRRSQLLVRTGNKYMPSIALLAYLAATDTTIQADIRTNPEVHAKAVYKFTINDSEGNAVFDIPTTYESHIMINYAGRGRTVPHASMADLLDEQKSTILITQHKQDPETGEWKDLEREVDKKTFFKDKILIWGATAVGVFDLRNTPFDENFPGVETHANVVDNLLRRDFLHRNVNEKHIMPVALAVLGIILTIMIAQFGALAGLLVSIFTAAAVLIADYKLLFLKGTVVSVGLPLLQTAFSYMALTFYKYLTEERSKKELRQTFSKYVSPQIVEEVLKDPKNLELGGRKEHVTVFFSDVRDFTTISEQLDPRALSDLLNSYLTPMTDLVFKNNGTLDKYMGDAIMAFFGAPVPMKDHAKWAARCALQHLAKLEELRAEYRKKGLPDIDIGIGLNTGEASVGNMGSQTVRNYTVMGDTVNLASRLEGINKTYGTRIIVSEFTYAEIKDAFTCREVDWVRVKGKNKPVKIYELVCEGAPEPNKAKALQLFQAGYELYHAQKFSEAIAQFESALAVTPNDETAKIYIERCQEYLADPPPSDWDGVYVMKTK